MFLIAAGISAIALGGAGAYALSRAARTSRQPLNPDEAAAHLDAYFSKAFRVGKRQTSLQVLIDSPVLSYRHTAGSLTAAGGAPVTDNQPFHAASIGKTFTATLIMMLAERGDLTLDSCIAEYLPAETLSSLFVWDGKDHAREVTIRQLLGHRSGVADYFEGPVREQPSFQTRVIENPDELWTPEKLLDFSRHNQRAVAAPGARFHYSDTGYILLGLLLERVTSVSLGTLLRREILAPLGMNDTYLLFDRDAPIPPDEPPLQDIWLDGVEISRFRSLSCDWAGGGLATTPEDLIRFQKGLSGGALIRAESLSEMERCAHKFRNGIHYGLGMMEIRFEGFFPLLRGMPRLKGHIGVLATHMFRDPATDTYVVMNFGSTDAMVPSFRALFHIMQTLQRIRLGQT